ncbi:hypothetical protein CPC08DRAFT_736735 [Agrocybe pediades]|nr:hypothetical protein CPC08DRAFT_736735 [Agrocybe pediades]
MHNSEQQQTVHLPQEMVDQIIDHLYGETMSLRSCALVCQNWLRRSRQHLFAKISLKAASPHNGPGRPQERCKRLVEVLTYGENRKEIVPFIRELEICEGSPMYHIHQHHHHHHQAALHHGHSHQELPPSTTWVTTDRDLMSLFRLLTHVRRFDFSSTSPVYWTLLPPTFINALYTLLSCQTLNYVRFHSFIFPNFSALSSVLSHCQNLRAFALSSTSISNEHTSTSTAVTPSGTVADNGSGHHVGNDDGDGDTPAAGENVPSGEHQGKSGGASGEASSLVPGTSTSAATTPLEVLTLDFVNFAYLEYWLLGRSSLVDIKSLRELRVAHFHDAEIIRKLLQAVGDSLEHLHLKPGSWNVQPFDLSVNSGLRSIKLTLDDPATAMDWTLTLLSTITLQNALLTSVGLEFYIDPKKVSNWDELDALFTVHAASELASLQQVEIGLFALPTNPDFLAVKEKMAGLDAKGIARWYQLGVKSHRSSRQLTPRISRYES